MTEAEIDSWLADNIPRFSNLTDAVVTIMRTLLAENEIEYLSVSGRTKSGDGCREKIKRKVYTSPETQLTDISGIRIVVYFESDVHKVCRLIESTFEIDRANSLDKVSLLATNQVGYRSVHYVCEMGKSRSNLPEYAAVSGLKFEFQVRTVLQHAWAEISHDRSYKFEAKLPPEIERKLFLYAGLLEVADKGFDDIASEIKEYIKNVSELSAKGDLNIPINALSLAEFVERWTTDNGVELSHFLRHAEISELVSELEQFGIRTLEDLNRIIPAGYADNFKAVGDGTTIFGLIRNWMLISNFEKFSSDVKRDWVMLKKDMGILHRYFSDERCQEIFNGLQLPDETATME